MLNLTDEILAIMYKVIANKLNLRLNLLKLSHTFIKPVLFALSKNNIVQFIWILCILKIYYNIVSKS